MTKLVIILLQFLLCIGLLISLILDMPVWDIPILLRGVVFLILLVVAWNVLSHFFDELFARSDKKTESLPFDDESETGYFDTNRQWRERGYHIEDKR